MTAVRCFSVFPQFLNAIRCKISFWVFFVKWNFLTDPGKCQKRQFFFKNIENFRIFWRLPCYYTHPSSWAPRKWWSATESRWSSSCGTSDSRRLAPRAPELSTAGCCSARSRSTRDTSRSTSNRAPCCASRSPSSSRCRSPLGDRTTGGRTWDRRLGVPEIFIIKIF